MTVVTRAASTPTTFLGRVQWALDHHGWQNLGVLQGDQWRESDIAYDTASGNYYVFSTTPQDTATVFRAASSLTAIKDATPVASGVGAGTWYPSVEIHENGTWYLLGTSSSTSSTWGTSAGAPTGAFTLGATPTFADAPAGQIDADFKRVTISGTKYWFMVAISGVQLNGRNIIRVYRHADNIALSVNTWAKLQGSNTDVFRDIGYPAWAADANPDPNLIFPGDGKMYLTFNGVSGGVYNTGIVELQLTGTPAIAGAFAIGTPILLSTPTNPSWSIRALSDITFLRCPDGVDRLFGWINSYWGCLELPPAP